MMNICEYFNRD